jgi:AcrR family transcriptional regulator
MGSARDSETTRNTIINAAGELFGARGFSGVTARDVAKQAGVALSAIPYHFGSMENLYREALLRACAVSPEAVPLAEQALKAEPEEGLELAIRWAMEDFAAITVEWPLRLIAREELDPSPAFKDVLEMKFRPEWNWLCVIVARATGRTPQSPAVKFGVITMYTMVYSMMARRGVMDQLAPEVLKAMLKPNPSIRMLAGLTHDAVKRFEDTHASARKPRAGKGRTR